VECWLHERGCDLNHFELFRNHLPHDILAIDRLIRERWRLAESDPNRQITAAQWYLDRVNRIERNWHSFVKRQSSGLLPEGWDTRRKNIAIYCSSDDEFVAIGDCWRNALYSNQVIAVRQIAHSLQTAAPEAHLYLRVHPNLSQVDNPRMRSMMALANDNLTVIAPDSRIDTYQLLKSCDCAVSFGSSVGMEAVFWNKPSVLLGPCLYQHLEGTYQPNSHQQVIDLLCRDLDPQSKLGAFMYGYWLQTRGERFRFYEATGLFEGTFKGQPVFAASPKKPKHAFAKRMAATLKRLVG
jgi:hypothetical protein